MKLNQCVKCGQDWTNTHFNEGEGLTLAAYWCDKCNLKAAVFLEDLS